MEWSARITVKSYSPEKIKIEFGIYSANEFFLQPSLAEHRFRQLAEARCGCGAESGATSSGICF